jgi:hypothetical protein
VRSSIARPGDVHDARFTLHYDVVAGPILLNARVSETRDRAIHHGGTARLHGIVAQAEAIHCAGAKVLYQHIRDIDEAPEHLLAALAFHVERDALLVAVDGEEIGRLIALKWWRKRARVVAFSGALHLDHLGPEIAEMHGAVGARKHPGQVNDPKPF